MRWHIVEQPPGRYDWSTFVPSCLCRLSGWLACRTTIGVGVRIRLDLFEYLSHRSMRYFADNLAGSLGHRSVLDNIRFGRPDAASDAEVIEAATLACCDDFVRHLPDGYDSVVGECGVKLSGGQRQRIGIACAFLKDAPILIMHEATSALDTESEVRLQRNVVEKFPGRTVIAVAPNVFFLERSPRAIH